MKTKTILYLGNKLNSKGANPTSVDILSEFLVQEGLSIITYSSKKNKLIRLLDMLIAIIRHQSKVDYALIDTYSTSAFWFAYISAKLLKRTKVKYIPMLRGGDLPARYFNNEKKVAWLLNNAKINVTPSDYLFNFFNNRNFKNIIKVRNSININNYIFNRRIQPKPNLLWVRAFDKIYNPLLAIKTLELLLDHFPEAKLSMVGPVKDNSFEECKTYVADHQLPVKFTGKLSKKKWMEYAQEFDIFLNTTYIDNTPISVIEAMAMGMLVVSTNVGGIPYLIQNGKNGILVHPNYEKEMAKAVEALLTNTTSSKDLSKNARLKAEEFNWEMVKQKWLDVLK